MNEHEPEEVTMETTKKFVEVLDEGIMKRHVELMEKALTPPNVGGLHAAFDDVIDQYVEFNNGRYDASEHRRQVRRVCEAGVRLLQAFQDADWARYEGRYEPRQPWILRRR